MRTQSKDEFKEAMRRAKEQAADEAVVFKSAETEPIKRGRKPKTEKKAENTAKEIKTTSKRKAEYNPAIDINEEPVAAAIDIKAISKAESNAEAVRAAIALMDSEIEKLKRQSQRYSDMAFIYIGYRKSLEEIIQS